jgi:RimJ/RimL family protein N-acetyltransferase
MTLDIIIKKPSECNNDEIQKFFQYAIDAGEVMINGLKRRIENAELLGFGYIDRTLVGIVALKNPDTGYKLGVFRKAGLTRTQAEKFDFELGYAYTLEKFRGKRICPRLIKAVLEKSPSKKIYATTKESNEPMEKINEQIGFEKMGIPYMGDKEKIQLYLLKNHKTKTVNS